MHRLNTLIRKERIRLRNDTRVDISSCGSLVFKPLEQKSASKIIKKTEQSMMLEGVNSYPLKIFNSGIEIPFLGVPLSSLLEFYRAEIPSERRFVESCYSSAIFQLKRLHSNRILHNDSHTSNIIIGEGGKVYLIDFEHIPENSALFDLEELNPDINNPYATHIFSEVGKKFGKRTQEDLESRFR